jgi:hypothetical protein
LLITTAVWLLWPIHQPKSWANADALVSDLVGVAKSSSGQVDLSKYADVVCFVAESLYARGFARERFPTLEIVEDDKADRSEGAWFILLIFEGRKTVEIYSVDQRRLLWDVPEETPVQDAQFCVSTIVVNLATAVPKIEAVSKTDVPPSFR